MRSGFSLAEEAEDSGKRLHLLIDFVKQARRIVSSARADLGAGLSVSVSQSVVEQIIYLAYWENYHLQFDIGNTGECIVIWAHSLNQQELSCILDQFEAEENNQEILQGWIDFLCTIISGHADIWQIYLVIHESIYAKFIIPAARVFIEVETTKCQALRHELPGLIIASQ
jgi:hypothetical protein